MQADQMESSASPDGAGAVVSNQTSFLNIRNGEVSQVHPHQKELDVLRGQGIARAQELFEEREHVLEQYMERLSSKLQLHRNSMLSRIMEVQTECLLRGSDW